jgi:hypothetical protein
MGRNKLFLSFHTLSPRFLPLVHNMTNAVGLTPQRPPNRFEAIRPPFILLFSARIVHRMHAPKMSLGADGLLCGFARGAHHRQISRPSHNVTLRAASILEKLVL